MEPHHHRLLASVAHLSNAALLVCVKRLAARERSATAVLIAHLAELDERRLYLAEGYSSLFIYCTQVLHLSEHAAYNRIEAARAARKFPILLARLADGSVPLTTIRLLVPHLTPENHLDLLEKARHQTKRDVEDLVAQLHPQPPVPARIRKLPAPRHPTARTAIEGRHPSLMPCTESPERAAGGDVAVAAHLTSAMPPGKRPAMIAPLGAERYKIAFTATAETKEKLRQAQALLRHQVPDGDVATIIDRALTALLEQVAKKKVAATGRSRQSGKVNAVPREVNAAARSRHIPNAVKRAVWVRDGGRCAFVSRTGRRCAEDGFLEFHHVRPYSAGGEANAENIELRCCAHNAHEAELRFGTGAVPIAKGTRAACSTRPESPQTGESCATCSVPVEASHIRESRQANSSRGESHISGPRAANPDAFRIESGSVRLNVWK